MRAPDGTVAPPSVFTVICRPEDGGAGIQKAIDACHTGDSILLLDGVYDVPSTLRLRKSVLVFGDGSPELRGSFGHKEPMVEVRVFHRGPRPDEGVTFHRVRFRNLSETLSCTVTCKAGGLRLQGCDVSALPANGYSLVYVSGTRRGRAELIDCTFRGGGGTVLGFWGGVRGRVTGCEIVGNGRRSGLYIEGPRGGPEVANCTFRECPSGVFLYPNASPAWALGAGNSFDASCRVEGGVVDKRNADVHAAAEDGPGPGLAGPVAINVA